MKVGATKQPCLEAPRELFPVDVVASETWMEAVPDMRQTDAITCASKFFCLVDGCSRHSLYLRRLSIYLKINYEKLS